MHRRSARHAMASRVNVARYGLYAENRHLMRLPGRQRFQPKVTISTQIGSSPVG